MPLNLSRDVTANHAATTYEFPVSGATMTPPALRLPAAEQSARVPSLNGNKASEVARFLIHLAASEEEPEFLTHLQLQKLLYFAQGWSLVMRKSPLFSERIEAWAHGPVVLSVYSEFKGYGEQPISPKLVTPPANLSNDEKEFCAALWNGYKKYSASSLRQMTHEHEPWIAARKGLRPGEACTKEITKTAMKTFFTKLSKA